MRFDATFEKFTAVSNAYSPYYSWETHLTFDVGVYQRGPNIVQFRGEVQSVGTANFGSRIGVGGTGYLLRLGYARALSLSSSVSAGIAHLSSHLTRDLDEKTGVERQLGRAIPHVDDPSEYNVLFVEGRLSFPGRRFAPEVRLGLAPVNLRLDGRVRGGNRRPVYGDTRWTLWRGNAKTVFVRTEHEVGANPINRFTVALEATRENTSGRWQIFASLSPGRGMHVSPDLGGLRDGLSAGLRLTVTAGSR
jgi:hypothetical protein